MLCQEKLEYDNYAEDDIDQALLGVGTFEQLRGQLESAPAHGQLESGQHEGRSAEPIKNTPHSLDPSLDVPGQSPESDVPEVDGSDPDPARAGVKSAEDGGLDGGLVAETAYQHGLQVLPEQLAIWEKERAERQEILKENAVMAAVRKLRAAEQQQQAAPALPSAEDAGGDDPVALRDRGPDEDEEDGGEEDEDEVGKEGEEDEEDEDSERAALVVRDEGDQALGVVGERGRRVAETYGISAELLQEVVKSSKMKSRVASHQPKLSLRGIDVVQTRVPPSSEQQDKQAEHESEDLDAEIQKLEEQLAALQGPKLDQRRSRDDNNTAQQQTQDDLPQPRFSEPSIANASPRPRPVQDPGSQTHNAVSTPPEGEVERQASSESDELLRASNAVGAGASEGPASESETASDREAASSVDGRNESEDESARGHDSRGCEEVLGDGVEWERDAVDGAGESSSVAEGPTKELSAQKPYGATVQSMGVWGKGDATKLFKSVQDMFGDQVGGALAARMISCCSASWWAMIAAACCTCMKPSPLIIAARACECQHSIIIMRHLQAGRRRGSMWKWMVRFNRQQRCSKRPALL